MHAVVINKEIFEFTCTREQTAKDVQKAFAHYLAPQLHALILKLVTEYLPYTHLQIDRMEFNLGDLDQLDLSQEDILQNFEQEFIQQLLGYKNKLLLPDKAQPDLGNMFQKEEWLTTDLKSNYSFPNASRQIFIPEALTTEERNKLVNPKQLFTRQQEWELVQTFLKTGNLPWWVDKTQKLNLDAIINRVITQQTQVFLDFLKNQPLESLVWQRLTTCSKPATRDLIYELNQKALLPENLDPASSPSKKYVNSVLFQLSREQVTRLKLFFRRFYLGSEEAQKISLSQKLLALPYLNWIQQAALFDWLPEPEFKTIMAYYEASSHFSMNRHKAKVKQVLQKLSFIQLEFLLFPDIISGSSSRPDLSQNSGPTVLPDNKSALFCNPNDPATLSNRSVQLNPAAKFNNALGGEQGKLKAPGLYFSPENFLRKPNQLFGCNWRKYLPDQNFLKDQAAFPANAVKEQAIIILPDAAKKLPATSIPLYKSLNQQELTFDKNTNTNFSFARKEGITHNLSHEVSAPETAKTNATDLLDETVEKKFKKIDLTTPAIKAWRHQLNKKQLNQLQRLFTQPNQDRRVLIRALEHQPALLNFSLFRILVNVAYVHEMLFSPEEIQPLTVSSVLRPKRSVRNRQLNLVNKLQAQVQVVFQSLSVKDKIVLQEILEKARNDSPAKKSMLRRILLKLPTESLTFLQALTQLPASDLQVLTSLSPSEKEKASPPDQARKYYLDNAGLCLLAPYLPGLFTHLGYLENKKFKNLNTTTRAMQVLQYLVTGRRQSPEYSLTLNKVLCGYKSEASPAGKVRLSAKEIKEADSLLQAVIQHWKALKNTSPQGLQQTFLQRQGILTEKEKHWTLQVERKGPDLLLTTIPWGFTLIKLPWMEKMLLVEWGSSAY